MSDKEQPGDYRRITDALAGALDRLAERRKAVESAQGNYNLTKASEDATRDEAVKAANAKYEEVVGMAKQAMEQAQVELSSAQEAAHQVQSQLRQHLDDILPAPNRRPK